MSRARISLVVLAVLLTGGAAVGQDWPRFRGPNGSGVSDTTGLPVAFGPATNLLWRTPLPFGRSSPVVAGDTLLLVCDTRTKAFLIAVDPADGRVRWRVERSDIRFEGHASPVLWEPSGEPAQVIVLGVNRLDAYAVATGERLWWVRGLAFLPIASPVVGRGLVLVSTWGSEAPAGPSFQELLKSDANRDGRVSRDEAKDFDEFGAVDKDGDGFIYEREWDELRNAGVGDYGMVAVRPGGRGDLTGTGVVWRDKRHYSTLPTSLIYKDVLYVVKSGGVVASLDPQTGEVFKVDRTKEALGEYYSSPVAADDKVFLVNDSGKVTVVRAGRQWETLAVNDLGEETYATPAIAAGKIFIRTRNALYCFGTKEGSGSHTARVQTTRRP